ncbi:MAG: hypothetical protein HRU15_14300, partial [Planctomycetes bacterium]|nr:hypothetical protein [Planctomycetota bacterium]
AVVNLPIEHQWYPMAAERWAMGRLSAVAPGVKLLSPTQSQIQSLEKLIEQLSTVAWHNDSEQACRCRYLLAQAFAQIGEKRSAQICFESLLVNASDLRKSKLEKALARLEALGDR